MVLLGAAALVIAQPLLRGDAETDPGAELSAANDERLALEDAKASKYREIRDLEVDFRSGKLSETDFKRLDSRLRAEAIELLKQIDRVADDTGG